MSVDDRELRALAHDLNALPGKTLGAVRGAYSEGADRLTEAWRANAKETSGEHGKHYPNSITSQEMLSAGIVFEVGPERGRKQGNMGPGFEYGSVNQPPHMDGNRAADKLGPVIEKMVTVAAEGLF